ncbi:hypothetical protein GGR50DRAFT_696576 [Xylaria sp. CBS 124048]|nr:hypothetical protein GGR50DRAFT_696576 [Xylaria sp. CBS 124048]
MASMGLQTKGCGNRLAMPVSFAVPGQTPLYRTRGFWLSHLNLLFFLNSIVLLARSRVASPAVPGLREVPEATSAYSPIFYKFDLAPGPCLMRENAIKNVREVWLHNKYTMPGDAFVWSTFCGAVKGSNIVIARKPR